MGGELENKSGSSANHGKQLQSCYPRLHSHQHGGFSLLSAKDSAEPARFLFKLCFNLEPEPSRTPRSRSCLLRFPSVKLCVKLSPPCDLESNDSTLSPRQPHRTDTRSPPPSSSLIDDCSTACSHHFCDSDAHPSAAFATARPLSVVSTPRGKIYCSRSQKVKLSFRYDGFIYEI